MKTILNIREKILIILYLIYGILNITGCEEAQYEIKKYFGSSSENKNHIDIFVDISDSRSSAKELSKDSIFITSTINELKVDDILEVYFIHSHTFSLAEQILKAKMPAEPGPQEFDLINAKDSALKLFKNNWSKEIRKSAYAGLMNETDLTGVFLFIKEHKIKALHHSIVILSDMFAVRKNGWNFERTAPAKDLLDKWQKEGLIPDLTDKSFFVFGCMTLPYMTEAHFIVVREFWKEYFVRANARLECYQSQRESSLLFE